MGDGLHVVQPGDHAGTEGILTGGIRAEGVVQAEVRHTVEAGAAGEEERPMDGPKTIGGDSDEYLRRTRLCSCCRTVPSNPLAMDDDQD